MVKKLLIVPVVFVFSAALVLSSQKNAKKPDVHPDFQFGSYPWSRNAETMLKDDLARQILVAYSQGWSVDKMAKMFKASPNDISKWSDKFEDERLIGRPDDYDTQALMPVVRERDWDRMKEPVHRDVQDFTQVLLNNWKDIESMVDSLSGTKGIPKGRVMYETVVST